MARTSYAIALGSNRRHGRHGAPAAVLRASVAALAAAGVDILDVSATLTTAAHGPAGRAFANAALLAETDLDPAELLALLKGLERRFGRRAGRRWGPRVLDLDVILWSEGSFADVGIVVPHAEFRRRRFVLEPLNEVVPGWRDPISGVQVRHLRARAMKPRPALKRR